MATATTGIQVGQLTNVVTGQVLPLLKDPKFNRYNALLETGLLVVVPVMPSDHGITITLLTQPWTVTFDVVPRTTFNSSGNENRNGRGFVSRLQHPN